MQDIAVEKWVNRDGLRLSYFVNAETEPGRVPLVFVPGGLGAAEDYLQDMPAFAPRASLAMSLRGQGRSDAPASGYKLDDFSGDVAAVLAGSGWKRPCLMAYSMAVPIAVSFAARYPDALSGLILGDYPAVTPKIPPEWVDSAVAMLGRLNDRPIMEAIQQESERVELWKKLPDIRCPVLVLRGAQPDARLSEADAARYQNGLERVRLLTFPLSGHALWEPDPNQFINAIKVFLAELDTRENG